MASKIQEVAKTLKYPKVKNLADLKNDLVRGANSIDTFEPGEILKIPTVEEMMQNDLLIRAKTTEADYGVFIIVQSNNNGIESEKKLFLSSLFKTVRKAEPNHDGDYRVTNNFVSASDYNTDGAKWHAELRANCVNLEQVVEYIAGKKLVVESVETLKTNKFGTDLEFKDARLVIFNEVK